MAKEKDYRGLEIYTEFCLLSSELRKSIQNMKRYYRFDVGDELRQMLRQIKYCISDIYSKPNTCKYDLICDLIDKINHLEIALSDCIEDGALSLKGRYNICTPLDRLDTVKDQAERWKNYIYDKYVQDV